MGGVDGGYEQLVVGVLFVLQLQLVALDLPLKQLVLLLFS